MAGDWIKWTKGLPDKPEVFKMAGLLGLPRAEVVCKLMRFWEWADDHIPAEAIADDTAVIELSPRDSDNVVTIDTIVSLPGFTAALGKVGWVQLAAPKVLLPNFGRHNGETAKTRARNAATQRRLRQKHDQQPPPPSPPCHPNVTTVSPPDGDKMVTRGEGEGEGESEEIKSEDRKSPPTARGRAASVAIPEPPVMTFPCTGSGAKEWPLTTAKAAEWVASFPGVNVEAELRKARQWLLDNPTRQKTYAGMTRFLGSWLGRCQNAPGSTIGTRSDFQTEYAQRTFLSALEAIQQEASDGEQ